MICQSNDCESELRDKTVASIGRYFCSACIARDKDLVSAAKKELANKRLNESASRELKKIGW